MKKACQEPDSTSGGLGGRIQPKNRNVILHRGRYYELSIMMKDYRRTGCSHTSFKFTTGFLAGDFFLFFFSSKFDFENIGRNVNNIILSDGLFKER